MRKAMNGIDLSRKIFGLAAGLLVFNGLLHMVSLQFPIEPATEQEAEILNLLQRQQLPSFEGRTFMELNRGVSYGVALVTIMIGLQNLLLFRQVEESAFHQMLLLNLAGWTIVEIFFIRFVITPPILLWGLAVLLFLASLILKLKR